MENNLGEKVIVEIKTKKDEYTIILNDNSKLVLDEDAYTNYYLYEGKILSQNEILSIKDEISLKNGKKYVLSLLNKRLYSKKDVLDKLINIKKIPYYKANQIVKYYEDCNLLNDVEYGKQLIYELEKKGYGYNRICNELKKDNINIESIGYYYDENIELSKAMDNLNCLLNKYKSYPYKKMIDSIHNAYLLLGFNESIIKKVTSSIIEEEYTNLELEKLQRDYIKITFKMNSDEIQDNKQKIINKLLRSGYSFSDIINMMEGK